MAFDGDPHRILGLVQGASLDEVKRAYRRLAKANHPDAAGITALPRFLAIQAAYEQLVDGTGAAGAKARGAASGGGARRTSEADPGRAEATRRAYGARARGSRTNDETPGRGRTAGRAPGAPEGDPAARPRPAGSGGPGPTGTGTGRRRGKATLGSTSYDDADAGAFEPDWSGANWYGTTSGTYWTINPKEYADPRKHGPEYQARARRASGAGRDGPAGAASATGRVHAADETAHESHETPAEPYEGHETPAEARGDARAEGPSGPHEDRVPDPARSLTDLGRALTDPRAGGPRGRVIRAFLGWLPIALGLGWLLGELTGCGRFAATCDPSVNPLILLIQGGTLVVLLLVPLLASLAAGAALGLVAAAMAATLILSATGAAADEASRRATLGVLLAIAWLAGLAIVIVQRVRSAPSRVGPVS